MRAPARKSECSYVMNNPFEKLSTDVLNLIDARLGLDAARLRCASKSMASMPLPPALALAQAVMVTKPDVQPMTYTRMRRHPREIAWAGKHWSFGSLARSRRWRAEWATLARKLESAPVNQLMDLRETLWSARTKRWGLVDRKIAALDSVLDERLWAACCGKDICTNADGKKVVTALSEHASTRIVQRMFQDLGMYNGPTSFFHTKYGWLQFTPFLLAAERGNLTLAKWLYRTFDPKVTIDARSQAGNNAHALCEAELMRTFHTPEQINDSEMLRWLREVGVPCQTPRNESVVYKQGMNRLAHSQLSSQSSSQSIDSSSESSQSSQSSIGSPLQ